MKPLRSCLALLSILLCAPVLAFSQAPTISGITPTSGLAGTQVTITGSGFGATEGSGNVWLGSTYGVVVSWSDAQVVATVASGSKTGYAQVLQGGVWSNQVNLTVATPTIASITPTSGVAGTQVTITGSGFGATQGSGNVWLGSTYGVVSSWSDAQVVATVASGSKTGVAQVLQGGVWSNQVTLTVATPTIASITPTSGVAGTQVTIAGSGFGATQGSGNVWLGSTYGVVSSWSDAQVVATVASGSKTGMAQVLQGGVWSNQVTLTVATPTIASITPTSGVAGTQVTIAGSGFGATQGSGNVWLGSTYGVVSSWSDAQVVATVASGSNTGYAQVLQGGVWSNQVNFTLAGAPMIDAISPTSGGIGTSVTLTGSYFGGTQGTSLISFNGTAATTLSWSDNSITATVPSGLTVGTVNVTVQVAGPASSSVAFTVTGTQPLFVTPNQVSMYVGGTQAMQALDRNGIALTDATWRVDDTSIAQINLPQNQGDQTLLQANSPGTTNLVVTSSNLSGTAKVTVFAAGTAFPVGTIQWAVPSVAGGIGKTVQALRVDSNTPDFYVNDGGTFIRALTSDGQQKWVWPAPGVGRYPYLLAGDDQGGAIYFAENDTENQFQSSCYVGRLDETGRES